MGRPARPVNLRANEVDAQTGQTKLCKRQRDEQRLLDEHADTPQAMPPG